MAKITRTLTKRLNQLGKAEILLRVTMSHTKQIRLKSGLFIKPSRFDGGRVVYPRANQKEVSSLRELEKLLTSIEASLLDYCYAHRAEDITSKDLYAQIQISQSTAEPEKPKPSTVHPFFETWNQFLKERDISARRKAMYQSLARALHRYEMYRQETELSYELNLETYTANDFNDFAEFYKRESELYEKYPELYVQYPAEVRTAHKTHKPQPRGSNSVVLAMKRLRAFFNWCFAQKLTTNRPFDHYIGAKSERYGTPFYLTSEERDQLAAFDFSKRPKLAVQRDIFIFQCYVGCRVSDLTSFTHSNVVGDFVEYVPRKTKKERQDVVRVPLHATAKAIINRYTENTESNKLLPFISDQRYNDSIKEMCKLAGLDRIVTVINPTTGEDERKPIWEVASSHMARRTFIGNLYKKVKDPNLIGSMSGHVNGSRAFARYRDIDDDIKQEVIGLLDK
ncbi:MAG: site-specific integrase [Bacteroidales bacterium]|nr:site-specific integrase [Bacteroidales bacterium]